MQICIALAVAASFVFVPAGAAAERNCNPMDNLDESAETFLERCIKGRIHSEFPGEMRQRTLGEIRAGQTARDKKGWKLLSRKIYQKFSSGPEVSPSSQWVSLLQETASWSVTVERDPNWDETLVFRFGDGSSETRAVAQGTGTATLSFSHAYYADVPETWNPAALIEGGSIEGEALPDGDTTILEVQHACG